MGRKEKLKKRARDNPQALKFNDFEKLLALDGRTLDRQRGRHRIWVHRSGARLSVQSKSGMAKGYQVKQFLRYCEDSEDEH